MKIKCFENMAKFIQPLPKVKAEFSVIGINYKAV